VSGRAAAGCDAGVVDWPLSFASRRCCWLICQLFKMSAEQAGMVSARSEANDCNHAAPNPLRYPLLSLPAPSCSAITASDGVNSSAVLSLLPALKRAAVAHCATLSASAVPVIHVRGQRSMCSTYEAGGGTVSGSTAARQQSMPGGA
jgi:hypothetical protein